MMTDRDAFRCGELQKFYEKPNSYTRAEASKTQAKSFDVNLERDTQFARQDRDLSDVAHIFHKDWLGIRSAVGVLPGLKVSISSPEKAAISDVAKIALVLRKHGVKKVVFHGFSKAANTLLRGVNLADIPAYLVWHGNLSQLVWEPEGEYFQLAYDACKSGRIKRAHMMKAQIGDIFPNTFDKMLLNSPPVLNRIRSCPILAGQAPTALIPATLDIRKNFYTSAMGACRAEAVKAAFVYAKATRLSERLGEKCVFKKYEGHFSHLETLLNVDFSVNVTTIDCHPMADLEALAAGTMAITGQLFLDALQEHDFTKLSEIENPFSIESIAERIDYICGMRSTEIEAIIGDYVALIAAKSLDRYKEFLGLY